MAKIMMYHQELVAIAMKLILLRILGSSGPLQLGVGCCRSFKWSLVIWLLHILCNYEDYYSIIIFLHLKYLINIWKSYVVKCFLVQSICHWCLSVYVLLLSIFVFSKLCCFFLCRSSFDIFIFHIHYLLLWYTYSN